jgi:hypothetical protein
MYFQFDLDLFHSASPAAPSSTATELATVDLLRQMLEVQKEHLNVTRAAHDAGSRWRAFLSRWREDFPDLPKSCRDVLPLLEKSYGALIGELAEHLRDEAPDGIDTDFALQELLDRFGMRLAQLGTLLNLVGPLAEASSQSESS